MDPGPREGWREVPDVLGIGTLWRCPNCGKKLVQRRMSHSCGPHAVEDVLAGADANGRAIWERFVEVVASIGPAETFANRGYAGFMVRARFAGMFAPGRRGASVHFWLKRRVDSPRFTRREQLGKDWIYRVQVAAPKDFDDELVGWLREAYDVGAQRV